MFDSVATAHTNLTHDMPCRRCGHARHTYLACSDECGCVPTDQALVRATTPLAPLGALDAARR